jgi:tRNA-splicing ligase RtcB
MAIADNLKKISDTVWELPPSYKHGMRVPARIIATEKLVREMDEAVYQQISNVATLPGIARFALCMPDGHSGYGFPIGGVAAMEVHEGGVISPGGIGFDINCGMRLVTTNLRLAEVQPRLKEIVDRLFERVPAGVGTHGFLKISPNEFRHCDAP